jgi:acid phosphatase
MLLAALLALPARAEGPATDPSTRADLFAVAWQQTSAEYQALCLQTYATAGRAVESALLYGGFSRAALVVPVAGADGRITVLERPLAVVMDLDETVIDNTGYQAWMVLSGQKFSPATWQAWVDYQSQTPAARRSVPGAVDFIRKVEALGVKVIYVSNRDEAARAATEKVLEAFGVSREGLEQRLLLVEQEQRAAERLKKALGQDFTRYASDKQARFFETLLSYHVLAYFGDNLYDFPGRVDKDTPTGPPMLEARRGQVETFSREGRWGATAFALPNPMYGSWDRGTLPKGGMATSLTDYGFGEFLKSRGR